MSLMSDFYDYLSTVAAVQAAVGYKRGSTGAAKLYPAPVPETIDKPYIVYGRSPETHEVVGSTFTRTTFRLDCYGSKAVTAQSIEDAVTDALDEARGTMGSTTVLGIFVRNASDEAIDAGDGSETDDHWVPLEVEILHIRAVASPTLS